MDLIRRGQHPSATCLSSECHNAVRWEQRIHWQWHRFVLDRASESLGEAGTVRQHDQHPIRGAYAELSQSSDNCGRFDRPV
jgi:hypothetical protein